MLIREQAPEAVSRILEITGQGFTALQLFEKTARLKDLPWDQTELPIRSIPIAEFSFSYNDLTALEVANYKEDFSVRPEEFFAFTDKKGPAEGKWIFKRSGPISLIKFLADLSIDDSERGIVVRPILHNDFEWPTEIADHIRLFKALFTLPTPHGVINDQGSNPLLEEIAAADGTLTITWEQLGLVGLVSTAELFEQFRGQNALLWRLTQSEFNPFNPKPLSNGGHANFWFLQKEALEIFQIWRWQLNNHIHSLGL